MTQFNKIKVTNKLHNAAIFNVDVDSKSQRMFMTKTLDILGSQMYTTKRKQHKSRDAGTERITSMLDGTPIFLEYLISLVYDH